MKIYISGPVTGTTDYKERFEAAEKELTDAGYEAVNPIKDKPEGQTWEWYMKKDLAQMLECDGLYVLEGWNESDGASLEVSLACELKMPIQGAEWGILKKLMNVSA